MSSLSTEELEKFKAISSKKKHVLLNVGGVRHEVLKETLDRLPNTRLGRLVRCQTHQELLKLCDDYSDSNDEYFFDRHMCPLSISDDLEYWGITELQIQTCCQTKYFNQKKFYRDEIKTTDKLFAKSKIDEFSKGKCIRERKIMWNLCEHPGSSKCAKAVLVISTLFVILSALQLTVSSLPEFQVLNQHGYHVEHPWIAAVEHICVFWFTLEFLVRLLVTPDLIDFFKSVFNVIDMLVIVPYYIHICITYITPTSSSTLTENFFRVLRVFRVFKLFRHSSSMRALATTFMKSGKEMGMLSLFFALIVVVYASFAYFAEHDEPNTQFDSVPAGFWWAAITMSTVGYGDMYPHSPLGKVTAAFCCLTGVIVIAMPISLLVTNFELFYESTSRHQEIVERKQQLEELNIEPTIPFVRL